MPTKIEWVKNPVSETPGESWNPVLGCRQVSEECRNCYALGFAWRHQHNPSVSTYDDLATKDVRGRLGWTGVTRIVSEALAKPLSWKKPRRVFVCSMSDLFFEPGSLEWIAAVFGVMAVCPQHTFILLTKRPRRAEKFMFWVLRQAGEEGVTPSELCRRYANRYLLPLGITLTKLRIPDFWPLPHVTVGTTIGHQATAGRARQLALVPARWRFVSYEPAIGPLDLSAAFKLRSPLDCKHADDPEREKFLPLIKAGNAYMEPLINGVLVGGETGAEARPMHPAWAESMRDQCREHKRTFHFKAWGEYSPDSLSGSWRHFDFEDGTRVYRVRKKLSGRSLRDERGNYRVYDEVPWN